MKLQAENAVFKCSSKVKEAGQKTFVLPYDLPPRAYTKSGMYTLKYATDYLNQNIDKNMYTTKFCDFNKMFCMSLIKNIVAGRELSKYIHVQYCTIVFPTLQ